MSGDMNTADGACALEIVSSDASRSDVASILQFIDWSRRIIDTCKIDDDRVKGGIAENLGQQSSTVNVHSGEKASQSI